MNYSDKEYGDFIRNRRKSLSITQNQLAEMLNCTYQAISKYENGKSSISLTFLGDLCKALQVDIDSFINLKYEKENDDCDIHTFSQKSFSGNLCTLRSKEKLSQSALAKQLDISSQKLSKWENSLSLPSLSELKSLSEHFKMSCSSLYYALNAEESTEVALENTKPPISNKNTGRTKLWLLLVAVLALIVVAVVIFVFVPNQTGSGKSSMDSSPISSPDDPDAPFVNSFDFEPDF